MQKMYYINRKCIRSNSKETNQEGISFENLIVNTNIVSFESISDYQIS